MRYLAVDWIHELPDEPIKLYSECDANGWEIRKIEVFPDGRLSYACASFKSLGTRLGLVPVPSLDEIAEHDEFRPSEITKEEFEKVWVKAQGLCL